MGKLNLSVCSGLSPLTTPQFAEFLGASRRSGENLIVSGQLHALCGLALSGRVPGLFKTHEGDRCWHRVPLEVAVALRQYMGGPGLHRPWGLRRQWDHSVADFKRWYEERKGQGWLAISHTNGGWQFSQPQSVSGAEPLVSGLEVNASDRRIPSGHGEVAVPQKLLQEQAVPTAPHVLDRAHMPEAMRIDSEPQRLAQPAQNLLQGVGCGWRTISFHKETGTAHVGPLFG